MKSHITNYPADFCDKARGGNIKFLSNTIYLPETGRNKSCLCGSGKKYKHCCWGKEDR